MNSQLLLLFDASLLAVAAAAIDVQTHRIPNWLTYPSIVLGFALRSVLLGWSGARSALAGGLLAGGIVLALYFIRAMGAGDLKLMTAIGILVGTRSAVTVLVATSIAGGVLAVIYMVSRRRVGATIRNLGSVVQHHAVRGLQSHPEVSLDNPEALRMPYGIAIAAGTIFAFTSQWWG